MNDGVANALRRKAESNDQLDLEAGPRPSVDSVQRSIASSTTPLRGRHERHHSLVSRVATASLHRHLRSHSGRHKRRSVHSVMGRPSSEMSHIAGPERFACDPEQGESTIPHTRKGSVAGSIVGSIRSIGRRTGITKHASPPTKEESLERPADTVPLPSSPVNIPMAAPALELDLGPGGFMSPTFGRSPERQQSRTLLKLTDPANITTARPKPTPFHTPLDTPGQYRSTRPSRPITPSDLLNVPMTDTGPSPPAAPATPMPGTNFSFEVDGTNSEKSEKSQVFERSVTPPNDKERKELRTMRSLDAMAEACTIAHANDEVAQLSEISAAENSDHAPGSPRPTASPALRIPTPRRNLASAETIHSCPSDMAELTRQDCGRETAQGQGPFADQTRVSVRELSRDDPFDDRNAVGSGPPSPTRSVELPFRPKVTKVVVRAAAPFAAGTRPPQDTECEATNENTTIHRPSLLSATDSTGAQLKLQRNYAIPEVLDELEGRPLGRDSFETANEFENVALEDDASPRAQQHFTPVIILPSDTNSDSPTSEGMSPQGGPLVPQIYHRINKSQSSSPRSVHSRNTYTAGLADAEYKFSFDNWLKDSSNAPAPDEEPATPHRRRMDMSLDSVSTNEERKTPQVSPTTTSTGRTPSMGNRLDFDLKRSQRNMRYNALYQEKSTVGTSASLAPSRPPPRFIFGCSEETEASGIQLADFESAYRSSREASPEKDKNAFQGRVDSEESVAASLKDAAFDYHQLEERLTGPPRSESDVFADPTDPVTEFVFSPSSGRSDGKPSTAELAEGANPSSPSWRKDSAQEQSLPTSGPALQYRDFTPTLPRDNASSIRFKGLPVMHLTQSTPSPPQPTSSTQAAAPLSSSSADSPASLMAWHGKDRVASSDTLDQSLQLFSSPDSGYQADKSSVGPEDGNAGKGVPTRYRGKSRRKGGGSGNPLGEISRNVV